MKKLLCLTMVVFVVAAMTAVSVSASELVYNAPVVNDTYEDGATTTFSWTKAHAVSGIISGTGFSGQQAFNDPGTKYMNFFSNAVTQTQLTNNQDNNVNYISGLKSYMTGDINYVSFDISSAWIKRNIAVFLDSTGAAKAGNLPVLLFRTVGEYYAGTHSNLHPWYYSLTSGFLDNDYSLALGSVSASYSEKNWYNVKFAVDNTSDTNNVSVYVNNSLVNTASYADSENFDCLIIKDYTVNTALTSAFGIDNVQVGTVSKCENVKGITLNRSTAVASVEFPAAAKESTLNPNISITSNGENVAYTGVYDDAAQKYNCTIDNFNKFAEYTVNIADGVELSDGTKVVAKSKEFEKTSAYDSIFADDYTTYDTLTYKWSKQYYPAQTVKAVDGENALAFHSIVTTGQNERTYYPLTVAQGGLDTYLNSKVDYISFDIMSNGLRHMLISPVNSDTFTYPITLGFSEKGYMVAAANVDPNSYGASAANLLDKADLAAALGAFPNAQQFESNKWYTIKFIIDKNDNVIKLYIDNTFCFEASAGSLDLSTINMIRLSHFSKVSNQADDLFYMKNFQIGKVFNYEAKIVNELGNEISEFDADKNVYLKASLYNTTEEEIPVKLIIASYSDVNSQQLTAVDTTNLTLLPDGTFYTDNDTETNIKVSTADAEIIKGFIWTNDGNLVPLCGCYQIGKNN